MSPSQALQIRRRGASGRESGFLLDTNVISELSKRQVHPAVLSFLQQTPDESKFLSVLTLGELRLGVYRLQLRKPLDAARVAHWVDEVEDSFEDRTLTVDAQIARNWARFSADRDRPRIDTLLAATAYSHRLTLVTRNSRDFEGLDIPLYNPWLEPNR